MKTAITYSLAIISLMLISSIGYTQSKPDKYKIELKNMTPQLSLSSDRTNLVIVVTVTNLTNKPVEFGSTLHYGYKKFNSQDYYLEAVDQNNIKADIDGEEDNELFFDDPDHTSKNINKISQKIITGAYNFTPGTYKIRWVYDPSANMKNPDPVEKMRPIYSNWETLNISQ